MFYGGDSGYFDGFKEIGETFGPFDFAMLECGAYSEYWPQIHMMPEETARAAVDLQANMLMPIHWGKFNLSLHSWTEPIERLTAEADELGLSLATPKIGQRIRVSETENEAWWVKLD